MPAAIAVAAFAAGAVVSLATSWLLVSRLERAGERLGLSEAFIQALRPAPALSAADLSLSTRSDAHET
jgi:hypothetical protein